MSPRMRRLRRMRHAVTLIDTLLLAFMVMAVVLLATIVGGYLEAVVPEPSVAIHVERT